MAIKQLKIVPFEDKYLNIVYEIQKKAFLPLFEKYADIETNPYCENKQTILTKYTRSDMDGYLFCEGNTFVGCVRIVNKDNVCKVAALAVLPEFQNRGIAQRALAEIEQIYLLVKMWKLDTIKQEAGNCHLYEKLGYKRTGVEKYIKDDMTIIDYVKAIE